MKLIIFEDEPLAQQRIQAIIKKKLPDWYLVGTSQSISEAKTLLSSGLDFDLLLCDIQLADGLSFEIFKDMPVHKPIIFITAYDQYALESFEHNCIDYVLKPIQEQRLLKAFDKHQKLLAGHHSTQLSEVFIQDILSHYKTRHYKKRFLAKIGSKMIFKSVEDIACFCADDKIVYMKELGSARKFIVNHNLEELEKELLDPEIFYRINRSVIVNLKSVSEMHNYQNGRLKLMLNTGDDADIIVARERVTEFKKWINQ